jgi:cytoskeletal protein CcmA (bactofilin family)
MSNTVRPTAPSKHTIVEEGSTFKGTLTSSCPIHVHGRIEGELETPALTVSATGAVHGRAKVGAVRSQGELSGEFDADSVELAGKVRDNTVIRARSLEVKLSSARGKLQVIFGECELSIGDEPTEKDVVEAPVMQALAQPLEMPMMSPEMPPGDDAVVALTAEIVPAVSEPLAAAQALPHPEAEAQAQAEAEADDDELDDDVLGAPAEAAGGTPKRRRKRKNGEAEPVASWSSPPSQPPPAN